MHQLASDSPTGKKIVYYLFLLVAIFVFAFYTINVEGVRETALVYWVLLGTGFVALILSRTINTGRGIDFPNPVTWEEETVFGRLSGAQWLLLLSLFVIAGGVLATRIGASPVYQIIGAPRFQMIEPTPGISAFLSGMAGVVEDFVFFGVLVPVVYVIVSFLSRNEMLGAIASLILVPTVFMFFHVGVYGLEREVAMSSVWVFGFIASLVVLLFRCVLLVDAIHFANNFAVSYFGVVQPATPLIALWWAVGIVAVLWAGYKLFGR